MTTMNDDYQAYRRHLRTDSQRKRRKRLIRIDFYDVDPEVKAVLDSLRYDAVGGDYSSIINRIVREWAGANSGISSHYKKSVA